MNKIIFTQDVPGEREWIQSQFPGHHMFESEFGGKWPKNPFIQNFDAVWEIPPDSVTDLTSVSGETYKSLYQLDTDFVSPKWCDADHLLIRNLEFGSQPRSPKAQVIHVARSGTVFLESILYRHFDYLKDRRWNPRDIPCDHYWLHDDDKIFYDLITRSMPDIYFVYRKNWWDWFVSNQICLQFDYYHYFDDVDWESLPPFEITASDMERMVEIIKSTWNSMCHFRTHFPTLNVYIIEFSDLIKHQHLTTHQAIAYDKKRLVKNYNEARELFDANFTRKFDQLANRCLVHLQNMNCHVIRNFDHLA
jgi:hypothetical protein